MRTHINLASQRKKNGGRQEQFNIGAIIVFAVVFVCAAGLLVYILILNAQSNTLDSQTNQLTASINQLSSAKLNILLLKERLFSIDTVLTSRTDINVKLNTLLSLLPNDLGVSTIETDETHISVTVTSPNLAELDTLISTNLPNFIKTPQLAVKKVDLDSFGIDQTGTNYFATLDFQF